MSDKAYEYKTIRSRGAKHHLIKESNSQVWKHHKWDGPAIIPYTKDSEFTKSYFLNGIEYSADDYAELMREREGLPWYKTAKGRSGENRN
tara:strand:- start:1227 stop:1496 length:270 start_codon:yes stop_codon:yes gene_type:complete